MRYCGEPLTARQKEILRLVADGFTSREIASVLKLSPRTVEVHRWDMMRRLRVKNVAQLLRCALLTDLLPDNYLKHSAEDRPTTVPQEA
jgi:DNA-binding NarL/FixJ family response regulator